MGSPLTQEQIEQIELDFITADLNNVSACDNMASHLMKRPFLCFMLTELNFGSGLNSIET